MRKKIIATMLALCVGALLAGGCAKKEVVKAEEPIPAVQKQAPAPQAKPETKPEQKVEPLPETPTKEAVVQPETPKETALTSSNLQGELQKIYFNFDSADLSQQSRDTLSKNADVMSRNSSIKVRIEGNCDERGSDEYNLALGERRAKAARDYLVKLGISSARLSVISYGEEKPVDPGHDESAWSKNRRDEFVIVK
ncbi:peptidoglycan-associated lipoprotein Pal [Geomonas sp.]|uniref:peptidoglycan-associated lipoprotein Pal n=1 Tax=Geomonas sp. TaxID=2651584 RepID=UPI002B45B6ED|nr:peptidoglycan-associated lipoprotein Pal [Geomonas sp.]HJV36923.1 peptidoglycan-associated lipoprotein Pal [Geomonas sp.]